MPHAHGQAADWTRPALFWVPEVPITGELVLDGAEGRHAADVRRIRPGEVVLVGDGHGAQARAEVTAVERSAVRLRVLEHRHVPRPQPAVTVVQALAKGDRGELAVELATEAGADTVVPWRAERSIARWDDGPRGRKALDRWRSTAREAAKQARRAWAPDVTDSVSLPGLVAHMSRVRANGGAALACDGAADTSLAAVVLPEAGELVLVVGPEGGVSSGELAALADAGATSVRFGPEVLRTSTAAAVALGALGTRTGRWR